ncbi:DUF3570 domain-containing protein [Flavobacterium sp.]|uniref:DUF3570 domain-containing protein n=1 Tax=Flavobacterium sp. TaxID=239 RepID=UPI0012254284|nr:DUF3570 domain-containing protein [Flavobacterium sp.]RZJ72719.1 MAG: DUF3570 domain-containing protein [Flavobacterium sp.]
MKKRILTGFALLLLMQLTAQNTSEPIQSDTSAYKATKLKLEEINLVSSYYKQDGNHSAVEGGLGTQKLTDISNAIDVKLTKYGATGKKHTFGLEVGIDHYSSASSDKIDPSTVSSASYSDTRVYPSLSYGLENESTGSAFSAGVSSSSEFDYQSFGANIGYAKKTRDKSGEFSARFQAYIDQIKLITPIELRTSDSYATDNRNTFALSLTYAQIVNKEFQLLFSADVIRQDGYLGLPFHRVYFNDQSVHQEHLPDSRLKIPLAVRGSYFLGDNVIIRAYYRYYQDDWKLSAHTFDLEVPVKLSSFVSVSPFYRFYAQTGTKYFAPYGAHSAADEFYTSNYDLSTFDSNFLGAGIRLAPPKGVFGWGHFSMLEIRYGHYDRSDGLKSHIVSLNLKYK